MPGLKHHIIGLCGYSNAGKDTVADLLVTHAGFMKLAWAGALYAEVAEAYGLTVSFLAQRHTKQTPTAALALRKAPLGFAGAVLISQGIPAGTIDDFLDAPRSPRQILEWWGTDYRRKQDPAYWTKQLVAVVNYRMHVLHERNFVITDCRFANEVNRLHDMGGELWQVTRPGCGPQSAHVSATEGSEFNPAAVGSPGTELEFAL